MEKQLVDALKSVDRLSELDEVSRDMIADRAYSLWKRYHKLLDTFTDGFEELTTEEPELCHLIGVSVLMSATDDFVIDKNKKLGRKSPAKCTIVYGDKHTDMMLSVVLAKQIMSDENIEQETEDED